MSRPLARVLTVAGLAVAQLACVGAAVAPQLSSRLTGTDYRLEVRPLDPIDPFRGAYVTLDYPGLQTPGGSQPPSMDDGRRGEVFIPLERQGEVWVAAGWRRTRPTEGPYLACDDRDWAIRCGIDSYFVSQDRAAELERSLAEDGGIATIRVDDAGHATVVEVR